jgi:hypothetical protein
VSIDVPRERLQLVMTGFELSRFLTPSGQYPPLRWHALGLLERFCNSRHLFL